MADMYKISGERLKGFADQVRRISGVEGELTPEQMETNLLNVTPLGEYPNAEESTFGVASANTEYGITDFGGISPITESQYKTMGWQFTAKQAFSIIGVRVYKTWTYNGYATKGTLWDTAGNVLATATIDDSVKDNDWAEAFFDKPVNIAIGTSMVISCLSRVRNIFYSAKATFNPKVQFDTGLMNVSGDSFPTGRNSDCGYMSVDIIITPVQAELPDDYQIQRTTMDDIAQEVQRISGATTKLTTAQIIAGLSEVEVLEDYEEVAF